MFYKNKVIIFLLTILLSLAITFGFTSCTDNINDENDEEIIKEDKPVHSVTFRCAGEDITLDSKALIYFEFQAAPLTVDSKVLFSNIEYSLLSTKLVVASLSKENSTKNSYGLRINSEFYVTVKGVRRDICFLCHITKIDYLYVYVTILDNRTLSITYNDSTTVYTVDSYSINYFDDLK